MKSCRRIAIRAEPEGSFILHKIEKGSGKDGRAVFGAVW